MRFRENRAASPARAAFEALPYSHRLRQVLAVEGAKAPGTRRRRVRKAVERLREGRGKAGRRPVSGRGAR